MRVEELLVNALERYGMIDAISISSLVILIVLSE
jgi:hypothetical protein